MADAKPDLTRSGTMQVTAKEGIEYLEASGKDKLLEMQGLKDPAPEKPSVQRDSTMAVTAKEGEKLLGKEKPDDDAKTRGQQHQIDNLKNEQLPAKKAKMAKGITMVGTAKEAATLLGDDKPDADAMTRGQQKQIEALTKETPPSPSKKAKMPKHTTMVGTAKEAKGILGNEKLGDTRAETKSKKGKPAGPKRTSTIAKTMEEATYVVPDINVEEGRRTRSQSKGGEKPGMKRAGTMQNTAKEGKDFLKRSNKKAKKVETVEEESEELSE